MPEWLSGESARMAGHLAGLLALSWGVHASSRWGITFAVHRAVARSGTSWDDAFVEAKVFRRLADIAPALVVLYGVRLVPNIDDDLDSLVERFAAAAIVLAVALAASASLNALNIIYSNSEQYRERPIKGYLELIKILIYVLASLGAGAILLDKSPWVFISGIGALAAVLLLVFKDTILSLVASVQIASNDMLKLGDWISMPQAGVDGDVIDVALHTVKVQNWDKTISTIPTYKFISESFRNWRGMSESGGRRIKRALNLDLNSIRFLNEEEIARLGKWNLLGGYLGEKRKELEAYNAEFGRNVELNADIRRLTNIGTFRAYVLAYLEAHPRVHTDGYTLIVRQLDATASGLPLEIYCFSNDQDWVRFEGIQSDIFDHIFAMVPEFGLRIFQDPTGADIGDIARAGPAPAGAAE
ncbi:MAG: mechanosensitive ion channel family protein [Myxococcota bacterium]|nr:mechanosensitive ion channel family protein [Myxococcota bacterium]